MLEFPRLKIVQRVKLALLLGIAILALSSLYQAVLVTANNLQKLEQWPRQPASIISLAYEREIEVEVVSAFADTLPSKHTPEYCFSHLPDTTCLLVPSHPYAWYSPFDDVELLQNPQHPAELEVLNLSGLWLPVFGYALAMFVLTGAGKWLAGSDWGEDRTWSNGDWIPSESAPQRVGFSPIDAEATRETGISRKGIIFWSAMCLGCAGIAIPGLMLDTATDRLEALIIITLVFSVLGLVWYSAVRAYSRVIYQDRTGLIDANLFGVKRVPWAAVGNIELVNLNKDAQSQHLRRFGAGRRPQDLNVYVVSDKQQRKILHLSQQMTPSATFEALLKRLRDLADKDRQPASEAESIRFRKEWNDMFSRMTAKPKSLLHRENRGLLIMLSLMLLPFLFGTIYLCYQSLWFTYAAERALGQIVEIKNDGLPSLVIEYQPVNGEALRIESDGSESYAAIKVGDTLTVFYQADKPENARIDLFMELWLGPIVMGFITGIVLVMVLLIARAMQTTTPGM